MLNLRIFIFLFLIPVGAACSGQAAVTPGPVGTDLPAISGQTQGHPLKEPTKRLKPMAYSGSTTYGLDIPVLSAFNNCPWTTCMLTTYYAPSVFADIANNLHASYVRTGWNDEQYHQYGAATYDSYVDTVIGRACNHGLQTLLILGGPMTVDYKHIVSYMNDVAYAIGEDEQTNPGCIYRVELANEPNLTNPPFNASLSLYSDYYEFLAPLVTNQLGLKVITGGTSGYKSGYCGATRPPVVKKFAGRLGLMFYHTILRIRTRRRGRRQLSWPVDDNYLGRLRA